MIVVLAVVAPLDHANVDLTAVACNSTDVLLHFKIVSKPALMAGGVIFWVTTTASVDQHPFEGSVAVTV